MVLIAPIRLILLLHLACSGLTYLMLCGSFLQGLDKSEQTIEVIVALQELIRLKDPALLSLEVLGFVTKYPDIR